MCGHAILASKSFSELFLLPVGGNMSDVSDLPSIRIPWEQEDNSWKALSLYSFILIEQMLTQNPPKSRKSFSKAAF
jgi:hypothetical protein